MQGNTGTLATIVARAADARDKDVPWVTIESTTSGSSDVSKSFAMGLGSKLFSKAIGLHLDHESTELARRVTADLPWGPGMSAGAVPVPPRVAVPEIRLPEPPSFGYMEWEGKRNFSAVIFSTSLDKTMHDTYTMEIPIALAGNKVRMDMDMSRMMKGDTQSPLSRMSVIQLGDTKTGYTLYPNAQKYVVRTYTEKQPMGEKPQVEKIKVGSEVIGKHPTNKFKVKITYQNGRVEEGFIWNATDLAGMTIKSEVENKDYRITTELRNIVLKTPPDSMFTIPEGYAEAHGFMDIMGTGQKNK